MHHVEDECYFIMECPFDIKVREEYLSDIVNVNINNFSEIISSHKQSIVNKLSVYLPYIYTRISW